jgi:hypothetical protein
MAGEGCCNHRRLNGLLGFNGLFGFDGLKGLVGLFGFRGLNDWFLGLRGFMGCQALGKLGCHGGGICGGRGPREVAVAGLLFGVCNLTLPRGCIGFSPAFRDVALEGKGDK